MRKLTYTITIVSLILTALFFGIVTGEVNAESRAAPSQPVNLQADTGIEMVTLTWMEPETDGGSPITNYNIYRGTSPGTESYYDEVDAGSLGYNDYDVYTGNTYYYSASASNTDGESSRSNEVYVIIESDPGQQEYSISGYVKDSDNSNGISNAYVEVINEDTQESRGTNVDSRGYYSITVPEGKYSIEASAADYYDGYESVSVAGGDVYRDIYLNPANNDGGGNDGGDGDPWNDGGGDGDGFDYNPDGDGGDGDGDGDGDDGGGPEDIGAELEGAMQNVIFFGLLIIITIIFSLIVIAIATVATFVRLGKIKKGVKKLEEAQQAAPQPMPQYYPPQSPPQQAPPQAQPPAQPPQQPNYNPPPPPPPPPPKK